MATQLVQSSLYQSRYAANLINFEVNMTSKDCGNFEVNMTSKDCGKAIDAIKPVVKKANILVNVPLLPMQKGKINTRNASLQ